MKPGRFTKSASAFAVASASLCLGLGLGLSGSAGAATGVTTPAAPAPRYVVLNCSNQAQVKPGTFYLACADGGIGLMHLHWTSWTPELASAYGTEWENDCLPNCAEGHNHDYPVVVELWGSASVRGEHRYTEATLSYPKARPAVYANGRASYPRSQVLSLG